MSLLLWYLNIRANEWNINEVNVVCCGFIISNNVFNMSGKTVRKSEAVSKANKGSNSSNDFNASEFGIYKYYKWKI